MIAITEAQGRHAHRVHVLLAKNKTMCGVIITVAQEVCLKADCQRCQKIVKKNLRSARARRINGKRTKRGQLKFANL
jgi:hypothetical protein